MDKFIAELQKLNADPDWSAKTAGAIGSLLHGVLLPDVTITLADLMKAGVDDAVAKAQAEQGSTTGGTA